MLTYKNGIGPLSEDDVLEHMREVECGLVSRDNKYLLRGFYKSDITLVRVILTLLLIPIILVAGYNVCYKYETAPFISIFAMTVLAVVLLVYYQVAVKLKEIEDFRRESYWKYIMKKVASR